MKIESETKHVNVSLLICCKGKVQLDARFKYYNRYYTNFKDGSADFTWYRVHIQKSTSSKLPFWWNSTSDCDVILYTTSKIKMQVLFFIYSLLKCSTCVQRSNHLISIWLVWELLPLSFSLFSSTFLSGTWTGQSTDSPTLMPSEPAYQQPCNQDQLYPAAQVKCRASSPKCCS